MKLIFLDFDGVLNNSVFFKTRNNVNTNLVTQEISLAQNLDPKQVKLINRLVDDTGAEVIITSSWRCMMDLEDINADLKKCGATFEAVGMTARIFGQSSHIERRDEIRNFLHGLKEQPTNFLILEDDEYMGDLINHTIKPLSIIGFIEEDVELAKRILNEKVNECPNCPRFSPGSCLRCSILEEIDKDIAFAKILELNEIEIVPAMLGCPVINPYKQGLLIEQQYTLDQIAQAYQKVLQILPDIDPYIRSDYHDTIIDHLDTLWQCIFDKDDILKKYHIIT